MLADGKLVCSTVVQQAIPPKSHREISTGLLINGKPRLPGRGVLHALTRLSNHSKSHGRRPAHEL